MDEPVRVTVMVRGGDSLAPRVGVTVDWEGEASVSAGEHCDYRGGDKLGDVAQRLVLVTLLRAARERAQPRVVVQLVVDEMRPAYLVSLARGVESGVSLAWAANQGGGAK